MLRGVTSTPATPSPPLCPRGTAGTVRVKETKFNIFFSLPPLCKCVTVRRDIVRRSVGSTKRWLCCPPYKNSRLSSFFLEVLVVHTHVSLLSPHSPSAGLVQKPPVPVQPCCPHKKPANSDVPSQNFDN